MHIILSNNTLQNRRHFEQCAYWRHCIHYSSHIDTADTDKGVFHIVDIASSSTREDTSAQTRKLRFYVVDILEAKTHQNWVCCNNNCCVYNIYISHVCYTGTLHNTIEVIYLCKNNYCVYDIYISHVCNNCTLHNTVEVIYTVLYRACYAEICHFRLIHWTMYILCMDICNILRILRITYKYMQCITNSKIYAHIWNVVIR